MREGFKYYIFLKETNLYKLISTHDGNGDDCNDNAKDNVDDNDIDDDGEDEKALTRVMNFSVPL